MINKITLAAISVATVSAVTLESQAKTEGIFDVFTDAFEDLGEAVVDAGETIVEVGGDIVEDVGEALNGTNAGSVVEDAVEILGDIPVVADIVEDVANVTELDLSHLQAAINQHVANM